MIGLVGLCAVLGVLSQEVLLSEVRNQNVYTDQVIQKMPSNDELKSWLNPNNGFLATENTPVYIFKKKEKTSEDTPAEYEIHKRPNIMKETANNLRKHRPDIILEPPNQHFESDDESSSSYPTVVYPEILVIIDYSLYRKLDSNISKAVEFTLGYWSGVDLLFRNLEQPKFRINIATIILEEYPDLLPMVEFSKDHLDASDTLDTIGKWLWNQRCEISLESYDLAVVMTGKQLDFQIYNGSFDSTDGIAVDSGSCGYSLTTQSVSKVVLVNEMGDFHTVIVAAREIAHSLAVTRDGRHEKCPNSDGTIMANDVIISRAPNSQVWSLCSMDAFTRAFRDSRFNCMRNRPMNGIPVPRMLPGKYIGLDKQCSIQLPRAYSVIDDNICRSLHCQTMFPEIHKLYDGHYPLAPADGSPCGQGKICLAGDCIEERLVFLSEAQKQNVNTNQVIQKMPSNDQLKSWLNPNDGFLGTENTPVYILKNKKKTSEGTPAEHEIRKVPNIMKQNVEYLRRHKPHVILEPPNQHFESDDKSSSSYPTVVYPEILVIIDYSLYEKLDTAVSDVVRYTLGYWSGVDLLFRNLEQPKFRINIAAILVVQNPDLLPVVEITTDQLEASSTLNVIGKWLYEHQTSIPVDSYDLAVVMTGKRLNTPSDSGSFSFTQGMAISNGTCGISHTAKSVSKVMLINDEGDFHNIVVAAHEIAHSLGVDHDGRDERCPNSDGSIMSSKVIPRAPNSEIWSQCSLDEFTRAFRGNRFSCLSNKPKDGIPVPRMLPGKYIGLDKQCSIQRPRAYSVIDDNICRSLHCQGEIPKRNMVYHANFQMGAADGSPCGQGKICLAGDCIEERLIQ